MILDHTYVGPALPWSGERGIGAHEDIKGAFRIVRYGRTELGGRSYAIIGNGENPEKFWKVDQDNFSALDRQTNEGKD